MIILITGAAGFIGAHIVEHILKNTNWNLVLMCRLSHAGDMQRLIEIGDGVNNFVNLVEDGRVRIIYHDFAFGISTRMIEEIGVIDGVFHIGASTHVDDSILDPLRFVRDNVLGTAQMLEYVRNYTKSVCTTMPKFIYFSTDEVFGPTSYKGFSEWDRYHSGNPYAATKAGAEELCLAYHNTYGVPVIVTHCMNVFGERQATSKFIPKCIGHILHNVKMSIHANKERTKAGSRFYIHARNVASAVLFVYEKGEIGQKYNIVGEQEVGNLEMLNFIHTIMREEKVITETHRLRYELVDFHSCRPGHDLRYALSGEKLHDMGWKQPVDFIGSLTRTVQWTLKHPRWL